MDPDEEDAAFVGYRRFHHNNRKTAAMTGMVKATGMPISATKYDGSEGSSPANSELKHISVSYKFLHNTNVCARS